MMDTRDELHRLAHRVAELAAEIAWLQRRESIAFKLDTLLQRTAKIMASKDEILAEIRANTDIAQASAQAIELLAEGHANIAELIADLKAQIEAGQTPENFDELDVALDDQRAVLEKVRTDISANAVPAPVE